MEYKNKRRLIIGIALILLLFMYILKNVSFFIRVGGVLFGLWIFYFFDCAFQIKFSFRHYLYIILILFAGILLSPLYYLSDIYDKILHLIMPIFGSIMIFFAVNKLKIKFQWKLLITFTSILSMFVLLEIGEYLLDLFLGFKLQGVYVRDISGVQKLKILQDPLNDTMIDMIFGLIGSLVFVIGKTFCYFYNRRYRKKIY